MNRCLLFVLSMSLLTAAAARAQGALVVSGSIVDAATGHALAFAAVTLQPAPTGVMPGAGTALRDGRVTNTDVGGTYRFTNVPPGDYQLHVQRIGYRSRSIDVQVRPESSARISIGLEIEPVALEAVEVSSAGAALGDVYARASRYSDDLEELGARRIAAERLRQRLYLATDVRSITHADITEGLSLGETDLFRSLHRFPGVSTADEWSAELWTRGAPWDQTRVYFDGIPVYNALHALGVFSGINSDAIGAAFLHPGAQPAALGGGAAGALDVRSRTGAGDGSINGLGELSLASARLALDRRAPNAHHAWMVSGRRTYVDLATRALAPLFGEDGGIPYTFFDVAARGDARLSAHGTLELSGLVASDHASGEIPDVLENVRARWGGGVARATLSTALGGLLARHTLGFSRYASHVRPVAGDDPDDIFTVGGQRTADNGLAYIVVRGEVQPLGSDRWSGGYELARYAVRYDGDHPTLASLPRTPDTLRYDAALSVAAAWAQRRVQIASFARADVGLRAEAGSRTANRGAFTLAPRFNLRLQLSDQTHGSLSAGRSWQYTQALAPSGIAPVRGFSSDFLWLLADAQTPALRADVATAGIEHWVAEQWILAINGYLRRTRGMTIPDPAPGELLQRPLFIGASNHARGVELSARRLTGRWSGSASYSLNQSTLEYGTLEFAAPADQRHTFDATLSGRMSQRWLVGAAYTLASGTPFTRTWEGVIRCASDDTCVWDQPPRQGAPAAFRRSRYQRVDVNVEWLRSFRNWQLSAYLQIHNLLNEDNQGRYVRAVDPCPGCGFTQVMDEFLPGLPIVPIIGARIGF